MIFVVVNKLENGYIIMAPNGDTEYITEETYQNLKSKGKIEWKPISMSINITSVPIKQKEQTYLL